MSIAETFLPEFDLEMKMTRGVLAVVPGDRLDWKPHEKSYTLGDLANHVATIPHWVGMTLGADELDIEPTDGSSFERPPPAESGEALVALLDEHAAEGRKAIAAASDETFAQPWALKKAGAVLFSSPKAAVLRRFVISHLIHHRAQLTVYLRMCDVPVPQTFGPTADFPDF